MRRISKVFRYIFFVLLLSFILASAAAKAQTESSAGTGTAGVPGMLPGTGGLFVYGGPGGVLHSGPEGLSVLVPDPASGTVRAYPVQQPGTLGTPTPTPGVAGEAGAREESMNPGTFQQPQPQAQAGQVQAQQPQTLVCNCACPSPNTNQSGQSAQSFQDPYQTPEQAADSGERAGEMAGEATPTSEVYGPELPPDYPQVRQLTPYDDQRR